MRTKIVVIGAGSASFGLTNLGAIMRMPELHGSELCLIDLKAEGLQWVTQLAERINQEWGSEFVIKSSTDRRELLPDADFVILSVAIDREKCWRLDYEIAQKYGIMHYAENGGPGGMMHTFRNIALIMPILLGIETFCPNAWVLNFTNPVPRICIAAARFTKVKMVGICHQIAFGYSIVANFLAERGMQFSERKTKLTQIQKGFDFLGYHVVVEIPVFGQRRIRITPRPKSVQKLLTAVAEIIGQQATAEPAQLIQTLNLTLRSWAGHYTFLADRGPAFAQIDQYVFRLLLAWAKRRRSKLSCCSIS